PIPTPDNSILQWIKSPAKHSTELAVYATRQSEVTRDRGFAHIHYLGGYSQPAIGAVAQLQGCLLCAKDTNYAGGSRLPFSHMEFPPARISLARLFKILGNPCFSHCD